MTEHNLALTTRFLCPISGCEWTHDTKQPPNPVTESVLRNHLETHGLEAMLREIMGRSSIPGRCHERYRGTVGNEARLRLRHVRTEPLDAYLHIADHRP